MRDSRLQLVKDDLTAGLVALNADIVNVSVVGACWDDAREKIVDLVDEGLPRSVANQLDAARNYINSALPLLGREYSWDAAEQLIGHAVEHVELAATNVVPLKRFRSTGGDVA